MAIRHLEEAKILRKHGERIGRAGISERIILLVNHFIKHDGSYLGAIKLAGRLHAIFIAAKYSDYWTEKAQDGYAEEFRDIQNFQPMTAEISEETKLLYYGSNKDKE